MSAAQETTATPVAAAETPVVNGSTVETAATIPAPPTETAKESTTDTDTAPEAPTTVAVTENTPEVEKTTPAPADVVETKPVDPHAALLAALPEITKEAQHQEMWGFDLNGTNELVISIILWKFLRANKLDVEAAKVQLTSALKWRKEVQPIKALDDLTFDEAKFHGVGWVTEYGTNEDGTVNVVTWNIYGAVKDFTKTFGDLEE
jgi:phosphatidylinositol transfer protein SFH5